jgi:hypothetical protein
LRRLVLVLVVLSPFAILGGLWFVQSEHGARVRAWLFGEQPQQTEPDHPAAAEEQP